MIDHNLEIIKRHPANLYRIAEHARTFEICKISVNKLGRLLEYVPVGVMNRELCRIGMSSGDYHTIQKMPIKFQASKMLFEYYQHEYRPFHVNIDFPTLATKIQFTIFKKRAMVVLT